MKDIFTKKQNMDQLLKSYRKIEANVADLKSQIDSLLDEAMLTGKDVSQKVRELELELQVCNRALAKIKELMVQALKDENAKNYKAAGKRLRELESKKADAVKLAAEHLGRAVASIQSLGDVFCNRLAEGLKAAYSIAQDGLKLEDIMDFDASYIQAQGEHRAVIVDYKIERRAFDLLNRRSPGSQAEHGWATRAVEKMIDPDYDKFSILNHK